MRRVTAACSAHVKCGARARALTKLAPGPNPNPNPNPNPKPSFKPSPNPKPYSQVRERGLHRGLEALRRLGRLCGGADECRVDLGHAQDRLTPTLTLKTLEP